MKRRFNFGVYLILYFLVTVQGLIIYSINPKFEIKHFVNIEMSNLINVCDTLMQNQFPSIRLRKNRITLKTKITRKIFIFNLISNESIKCFYYIYRQKNECAYKSEIKSKEEHNIVIEENMCFLH